jgi:putative ABC transport system permease protein
MDSLWQDIRYAFRTLAKTPAFTLVVVLTLAFGIGANAAIFSLMDQVLLRLLPVKDPKSLVMLEGPGAFRGRVFNSGTFSYPMFKDFRDRNDVFDGVVASFPASVTVTIDGQQAERADSALVSGNFFQVLGVQAPIGRVFTPDDERRPGGHPIVMLSHDYWRRRFAGNPAALNQTIRVNGHPMTIVGIAPRGFYGIQVGAAPDIFVPVLMKAEMTPTWNDLDTRRSKWLTVAARLKPSMSVERAEAAMNVLYRQLNEQEVAEIPDASPTFRERYITKHLFLRPGQKGRSDFRTQFSAPLLVLMGMVGLVLLIACANVANLLLARAAARQKEVAIRLALGAGRLRIVRQRLVESLLLACGGGALGLVIAAWTSQLLIASLPAEGSARTLSSNPDLRVLLFTLGTSLATAIVFGLAPAMQSARPSLAPVLKDEIGSVAGGPRHARMRKGLVVAQVALSVLLLAGAGLFARSLYNLKSLNPGFATDRLLTFSLDPALSGYVQARSVSLFQQLQREIAALPSVQSVSMAEIGALTEDSWAMTVKVEGYRAKEGEDLNPNVNAVGPGYFSTMGIPLVAGREFTDRDVLGAPKVCIINETMAKYFFGAENPLGRHVGAGRAATPDMEIVGIVKDAKSVTLREAIPRFVYMPYMQDPDLSAITFYARARGDARALATVVRGVAQRVDPNLPVFAMKTMEAQLDESLFVDRMIAILSMAFGALATLLAAVGLYGVMSYTVARRTREIGIRIALGAERGSVLWLVLREVASMAVTGVAIGLPLAIALSRLVRAQLFGLDPSDPATFALAAVTLATVALLAGYIPARRATRVNPMLALRYE